MGSIANRYFRNCSRRCSLLAALDRRWERGFLRRKKRRLVAAGAFARLNDSAISRRREASLVMTATEATPRSHRVVIIGAGFGGLSAAKQLAQAPFDVTVVDRHNYHLFQPLLYQVA